MDINFDTLRLEYRDVLSKSFITSNLDILENKIRSFNKTDVDLKSPLDQTFRDLLLHLIENEATVDKLQNFVQFCISACRKGFSAPSMPVVLLGDIFEALTLDMCEEMFNFVETNVNVWKEDLFFGSCKNNLLRLCNDLLRRLSRSTATVFCGKILLFLAKFFPFSERSGLNIVSEFNLENVTEYSRETSDDIITEISPGGDQKNIVIDFTFYCKFWQLQDFFRNPNQCYNKVEWKKFCSHSSNILNTFQGIKIDYVTNSDESSSSMAYFAKYLTSQKLLDLQLYDVNFRRSVLLQFLIVFQYLTSSVKFKSESYELKNDQKEWIQTNTEKVYNLLRETPPDGENFAQITQNILNREQLWNAWKNDGCPEIKRASPADTIERRKSESERPLLGDIIKDAHAHGKFYLGSGELTKLWNYCPDNLEACKAKDRDFLPTLEDYFADAIDFVETNPSKDVVHPILSDSNFGWRALRLLARRSPHFFTYNSAITYPLSAYLNSMVHKIVPERPGRIPESNQDSQNDAELEENILTEEEQNTEDLKQVADDFTAPDQISFAQLQLFSEKLGSNWPKLAAKLGFKPDEIEWYRTQNETEVEQARNMLQLWFVDDEDATLENLLYFLEGLELNEAAEAVRQEINSTDS